MTIQFNKEPIARRIEMYKKEYPDSTFIPNWVRNGFNSKEEALQAAIKAVEGSKVIRDMGL